MNEFSIVCRILGTLFQRSPSDSLVKPLIDMIAQDKLKDHGHWSKMNYGRAWQKISISMRLMRITKPCL